jgi:hypothetical protein
MGRPKGSKNKVQSGILYPRKCQCCEYISNNPAMWHYHDKTHRPIPNGQQCEFGCGNAAMFFNTSGKYTCQKITQHCPEYIKSHVQRTKAQWAATTSDDRKSVAKLAIVARLHNQATIDKMKDTKRKKSGLLTPILAKNYRRYARAIRERAQQWAIGQGYVLGQQTFHVDHRLSILDAWNANLPAATVNHPINLRVIEARLNSGKGSRSELTVDELLRLIAEY